MALNDDNNNSGMVMPVSPMMGGGNGMFGGADGWWIILLILLMGNGLWGGFGGMNNFGNAFGIDFPWLLNGQNGINSNINSGFQNAQLQDTMTSVRDGINSLATQLCGCCGDMQMSLANGFAGTNSAIVTAQNALAQQMYANQIASLERSYAAQTANTSGLTALQAQLAQGFCDNRATGADLRYTIATENCADRAALSDGIRDLLAAQTASTQRILDQLCQDKIDAKNDTIAQLRQELLYARGQASQDVQTAAIRAGQASAANQLVNELRSCPIPAVPVYGDQRIFTCGGTSCGCSGFAN